MYGAVCVAKVWGTQEVLQRDTEHGYDLFDMGAREATVTSVWEAGSACNTLWDGCPLVYKSG